MIKIQKLIWNKNNNIKRNKREEITMSVKLNKIKLKRNTRKLIIKVKYNKLRIITK